MRKKLLTLFTAIGIITCANAQILLSESFEGAFPPTGWALINNGTGNSWTQNTAAANSSVGTNSMKYGYNSTNNADAWAFTSAISLTAGEIVDITFDQMSQGSTFPEALKLTVGSAQTVSSQTTILYNNSNLINTTFVQRTATYTAPATGNYYFAFNCYSLADQWNLYIDNVKIANPAAFNAGVTAITGPTSCTLNSASIVSVTVKNFGSSSISSFPVKYSINGGTAVTETVSSTIAPGSSTSYSFTTPADLSALGTYIIKAYTNLTGDTITKNDSSAKTVYHIATSGSFVKSSTDSVQIPDNSPRGAHSVITFCGLPSALDGTTFRIKYLKIDSLTHTYDADLNLFLISPNNDSIGVTLRNGGNGDNIVNATFVDSSSNYVSSITAGGVPAGIYHTADSTGLTTFYNGQNPNGDWQLAGYDAAFGDKGTIHKWTLAFETVSATSVNEISKLDNDLVIFPNPTNGNLNISYKGEGKQLSIKLMDVSGAVIFNENVTNFSGNYSSLINMNEKAKGIYFIQVASENHVSTKKVILY